MSSPMTVRSIASWCARESALFNSAGGPFAASVSRTGDPRLIVVTGENASGKSLFVRLLAARAQKTRGWTPVTISIRERTGGGMRQAFMFGMESESSTGAMSLSTVRRAFEGNLDRPEGSILVLDEPEMGLSEGYTRALGVYIAQQAGAMPKSCRGVVVVTHSRALVDACASPPRPNPLTSRSVPGRRQGSRHGSPSRRSAPSTSC